jgi:hypothetical protein
LDSSWASEFGEDNEGSDHHFERRLDTVAGWYSNPMAPTQYVIDVGQTWTYSLKHTVTQAELSAARKAVTEVQKIGFFTCYVKKCTGDLQLDNYAKIWGDAYIGNANYTKKLTDADFETVGVNCPQGFVVGNTSPYGGSTAENCGQLTSTRRPDTALKKQRRQLWLPPFLRLRIRAVFVPRRETQAAHRRSHRETGR